MTTSECCQYGCLMNVRVKSDSGLFSLVMQKERELNDDNYHDYITNMNDFYEFGSALNSTERIKCE